MLFCKGHGRLVLSLFCLSAVPSASDARTWNIFVDGSGNAPTVQAGIDSAVAGDTVLVSPGRYQESINFFGKNIVVRSSTGPEQTLLDAGGVPERVVTFSSGESRAAILAGFTVTGGGGGVLIFGAEPTVVGNIIRNNTGAQDGGGILCGGLPSIPPSSPIISDNEIINNRSVSLGGGIAVSELAVPVILNNIILGNDAGNGDGGGIYYLSFDNGALIKGNRVDMNSAGDHGGGIYVAHLGDGELALEISWNLVINNRANGEAMTGNSGGGIWLWETNAWVHHNTIVNNTGDGPNGTYGGGIVIERPGSPIIEQNIIAFNPMGGGVWCGGGATPIIQNNFAWQNTGGEGVKDCPNWWQSNGNVVDNPYFCDMANGDYTVASNSGVITHPAGPLGAFPIPGCGPVSVQLSTWGALKARYKNPQIDAH